MLHLLQGQHEMKDSAFVTGAPIAHNGADVVGHAKKMTQHQIFNI